MIPLLFIGVLAYFLLFLYENFPRRKRPPGPLRFPPFGNLVQVALKHPTNYIALDLLAKKYGDVMSIKVGFTETITLSSHEAVSKIFNMIQASGRDTSGFMHDRNLKKNIGMIYVNGQPGILMREFCRRALHHYGYGSRNDMKKLVVPEFDELLKAIEMEANSNPLKLVHFHSSFFQKSLMNALLTLILGNRLDYNDERLQNLLKYQHEFLMNGVMGTGLMMAFPSLRSIFPAHKSMMRGITGFHKLAMGFLRDRRKVYNPKEICSFVDEFIQKIDAETNSPTPFFTEEQYLVVFSDIIQPGSDTTANVINFIVLHLTCNEEMQERAYQEIISVTGKARQALISDVWRMPYTHSVILEGLRWSRVAVFGAPRLALEDFTYGNYEIKKGTSILANYHSLAFDEEFWKDPNVFRPERFLGSNGKVDEKMAERITMLFGTGSRSCFGETLARDHLFLFTTSAITKFKFSLPKGAPQPNFDPVSGIVLHPHPYQAIVTTRLKIKDLSNNN